MCSWERSSGRPASQPPDFREGHPTLPAVGATFVVARFVRRARRQQGDHKGRPCKMLRSLQIAEASDYSNTVLVGPRLASPRAAPRAAAKLSFSFGPSRL